MLQQPNKRLRIAVCDDDAADRQNLVQLILRYLDKNNQAAVIEEFTSGEAFLAAGTENFGLVFLDIFMTGPNGIETAKSMFRENTRTKIVFCSSSAEFGVESYDVKAVRYLIKPAAEDKVFDVLDYFFHVYTTLRTITVKIGRMEEDIYINDILWIESDRHNCILHTKRGDIVTRATFDKLREQLPDGEFIQPIRYAMVSLRAVTGVPNVEIKLEDGTVIPIVKEARSAIKKAYMDYRWKKMYE